MSTSVPSVLGPGFFIFFQEDPPGSSGQLKKPRFNRVSATPEEKTDDDIAIATALLLLFCND